MFKVKVRRYFKGLSIETHNFAFEIKVTLGLETTHHSCQVAKIGMNRPHD